MSFKVAITGDYDIKLPHWGRSFWQDPNDGELFLAFASGTSQVCYITSADSGNTWTEPSVAFPVDDFSVHNNFDVKMDRRGHVHCGFRYNDSGCYRLLGKTSGGGWTTASGSIIPFCVAGDSGNVPGFQGTVNIQESPHPGNDAGLGVKFPICTVAAKASGDVVGVYVFGDPFTDSPVIPGMATFLGADNYVGEDGGFPYVSANLGFASAAPNSKIVFYSNRDDKYIRDMEKAPIGDYYYNAQIGFSSGDIEPVLNSVTFGSGLGNRGSDGIFLICSESGQALWSNTFSEDYAIITGRPTSEQFTAPTYNGFTGGGSDIYSWRNIPRATSYPAEYYPAESGVAATGGIYGVGESTPTGSGVPSVVFPGRGTRADFATLNNQEVVFYFQGTDNVGKQCLKRVRGHYDNDSAIWTWYPANHPESGSRDICTASATTTGGFNNIIFWENFKSCRHPTEPQSGVANRNEFVVTQGSTTTYPSGGTLVFWDVENSPSLGTNYTRATYSLDYTATSGSDGINVFQGVTKVEGFFLTSHIQQVGNMFDGDLDTYSNVRNGYVVEVELDKAREIDRLEMLSRTLTRPPEVTISGSFDGVNWTRVLTKPSGKLVDGFNSYSPLYIFTTRAHTIIDRQNVDERYPFSTTQPTNRFTPFAAKYLRFTFENEYGQNVSSRIYDMRLFGPGKTEPEIIRYSQNHTVPDPHDIRTVEWRHNLAQRTEDFNSTQQGSLPPGFRTYGDFTWSVVGSGKYTQGRSDQSAPIPDDYDGKVPSGLFGYYGQSRGYDGGNSLRSEAIGDASGLGNPLGPVPDGGIQAGHSGVVEIDVWIKEDEMDIDFPLTRTRNVSFRIRTDTQTNDTVEFWIIAPSASDSDIRVEQLQESWSQVESWDNSTFKANTQDSVIEKTYKIPITNSYGKHTLRWVYHKGAYDSELEASTSYNFGAAWIDMVSGIDASPSNYVKGYMRGENVPETGVIHGFMSAHGGQAIRGWMTADPLYTQINGYLFSAVQADVTSSVHGYMYPANANGIHGIMLGGDGTSIIPTGSILGFVKVPDSGSLSLVNGYLEGDWGQMIHGYVHGYEDTSVDASGDNSIYGYVYGVDMASTIHGILNGGVTVWTSGIKGYLNSRFGQGDQVIHGFMSVPSGYTNDIRGYTLGWNQNSDFFKAPQGMIHGYVLSPLSSGNESIHGYVYGVDGASSIYGYMGSEALVASGGGIVAGGPGGAGGSTSNVTAGQNYIHGYIFATSDENYIHGYLMGPDGALSSVHGYALAGDFVESIHGYTEGTIPASGTVLGYMSGIYHGDTQVNGILLSVSGIESEQIYGFMDGHQLGASRIFGHMIGYSSGNNSSELCLSHSFPLVAVPVVTIPTGNFF